MTMTRDPCNRYEQVTTSWFDYVNKVGGGGLFMGITSFFLFNPCIVSGGLPIYNTFLYFKFF